MLQIKRPIIASAAIGFGLGAAQVVRDNADTWHVTSATGATIALQAGGGGLIGAAFLAALMGYWRLASRSRRPVGRNAAPRQATSLASEAAAHPRTPVRYGPRHVVILIFGLGLVTLGGIVLRAGLAHPTVYGVLRGGGGAVFLIGLGGYLLWDDFIAPHVGQGTRP